MSVIGLVRMERKYVHVVSEVGVESDDDMLFSKSLNESVNGNSVRLSRWLLTNKHISYIDNSSTAFTFQ